MYEVFVTVIYGFSFDSPKFRSRLSALDWVRNVSTATGSGVDLEELSEDGSTIDDRGHKWEILDA